MSGAMKLLVRVIRRRVEKGEDLKAVLAEYPKLTEEERALVERALQE